MKVEKIEHFSFVGSSSGCYRCEKYKQNILHHPHIVIEENYPTVRAGKVERFCRGILAKNELIVRDESVYGCACSLSRLDIDIMTFSSEKEKIEWLSTHSTKIQPKNAHKGSCA